MITTLLAYLVAAYAGIWLHEIGHILGVIVVDGNLRGLRLWPKMSVYYEGVAGWQARAVELAPVALGVAAGPVVAVSYGSGLAPAGTWLAWTVMTIGGGWSEIRG